MDEPSSALDVLAAEGPANCLIDLWSEGKLTICSVLIVTRTIEEAAQICDRIRVFSSNPDRVANQLLVSFPNPRNRPDPAFREMVEYIYGLMTRRPCSCAEDADERCGAVASGRHQPDGRPNGGASWAAL
jgi:NitT/TauT family transport system ATP-binding protein